MQLCILDVCIAYSHHLRYWILQILSEIQHIWYKKNIVCYNYFIYLFFPSQMDPGQDLLLAALSESGICPNDIGLFDADAQDVAQPSTTQQVRWLLFHQWFFFFFVNTSFYNNLLMLCFMALLQSISISALDVGVGLEPEAVRMEPPAPVPVVTIRVRLQHFSLSQSFKKYPM